MMVLLSLVGVAVVLECILAYGLPPGNRWKLILAAITIFVSIFSLTVLLAGRWTVWIAVWIIQLYQLINVLRVAEGRQPAPERKRLASRTFWWLIAMQVVAAGTSWLVAESAWMLEHGLVILAIIQLFAALALLRSTLRTWRRTKLSAIGTSRSDTDLPTLSVLIPARNETDDLEACLTTLVANDYPKLEVIVLDDCSVTKKTPEIIRMFAHDGVQFIAGEPPDEKNWLAKNQAYDRLTEASSGEVLLFCGVDVRFERQTLRFVVETLLSRKKQMMSWLPLSAGSGQASVSLIQPMRYFWELALPRRIFNRPPVLSTCWLIARRALVAAGGFKAVSRKIVPEAYFSRLLAKSDGYSFVRSSIALGLSSIKPVSEQRATAIRTRYPQLHRRIELVFLIALLEFVGLAGPFILAVGMLIGGHSWLAWLLPLISYLCLLFVYYHVAVRTKLNSRYLAWLIFPFAVFMDIILVHVSMWKYEFSSVQWKDRDVCVPVMNVMPKLPKA